MAPPGARVTEDDPQGDVSSIAQSDAFRSLRQAIFAVALPLGQRHARTQSCRDWTE